MSQELDDEKQILQKFASALQARKVKMVVFDMDHTMVAAHSHGAVAEAKLSSFQDSIADVVKKLIPYLLENDFQVGVATLSDDLYTVLLDQRSSTTKYISGRDLVVKTLGTFLNKEQLEKISPLVVTLNPGLYFRRQYGAAGDDEEEFLRTYFHEKLKSLGIHMPTEKGEEKRLISQCYRFPPQPYKNHHLQILRVLTKLDYGSMILIDDKYENVQQAKEMGALGLHVEGKSALEWSDLRQFLKEPQSKDEDSTLSLPASGTAATTSSHAMEESSTPSESRSQTPTETTSTLTTAPIRVDVEAETTTSETQFDRDRAPGTSAATSSPLPTQDRLCKVCGQQATKRCARCHAAYYCSPDCQRQDWYLAHRAQCNQV